MGMMNRAEFATWQPGQKVKPVLVSCPDHGNPEVCQCPVKQEYRKETDVNELMKRYPGGIPLPVPAQAVFADVSEIGTLADVMRRGDAARDAFLQLPAKVRSEFGNDPYTFLQFLTDDKNYDKAVELGLIEKKPAPEMLAPVVPGGQPVPKEVPPAK